MKESTLLLLLVSSFAAKGTHSLALTSLTETTFVISMAVSATPAGICC